jgi:hypothetical protein
MGYIAMSEYEQNPIAILTRIEDGRPNVAATTNVPGLPQRQVHRLLHRFSDDGPGVSVTKRTARRRTDGSTLAGT